MKKSRVPALLLGVLGVGVVCGASLRLASGEGSVFANRPFASAAPVEAAERTQRLESHFADAKRACNATPSRKDQALRESVRLALLDQLGDLLAAPTKGDCFNGECRLEVQLRESDETSRVEAINSLYRHPTLGSVGYSLTAPEDGGRVWSKFFLFVHASS